MLVFVCVSGYTLLFSDFLSVQEIEFSRNPNTISVRDARTIAREYQETSVWNIFSRTNYLFLSEKSVDRFFRGRVHTIRSVALNKRFPRSAVITLEERHAQALLCEGEKCWHLDEEGYAFESVDTEKNAFIESGSEKKPIFVSDTAQDNLLGANILSQEELRNWLQFWNTFQEECGVSIRIVRLPRAPLNEFVVETKENWSVQMSTEFSLEIGVRMLKTFLEKSILVEERSRLQTIDLRSENKVFYTLQESGAKESEGNKKNEENEL